MNVPRVSLLRRFAHSFVFLTAVTALLGVARPASAWDSRTHKLIARLAIDALPSSPRDRT